MVLEVPRKRLQSTKTSNKKQKRVSKGSKPAHIKGWNIKKFPMVHKLSTVKITYRP